MTEMMTCIGSCFYMGGVLTVPEDFCWAWGQLRDFNREYVCQPHELIHYGRPRMSYHASARNWMVEHMRGDWLLMLDTDHVFQPDLLLKMLVLMRRYQLPILTGIYRHKALPHAPVLWIWDAALDGFRAIVEYDPSVEVFRVDGAGGGCLLIHKSVFSTLAKYFSEPPFEPMGKTSEDLSFFKRCRQAEIPVYATPLVDYHHLMLKAVTDEDYMPAWHTMEDVSVQVPGEVIHG